MTSINISHILLFTAVLFAGCKKEDAPSNQPPTITLAVEVDELQVHLTGQATDIGGAITSGMILWGDGMESILTREQTETIDKVHTYGQEGSYEIIATATDDGDASTHDTLLIDLSYSPTSLDGVAPDLYKSSPEEYLILTLNLHTYQESQQAYKLQMLSDVIGQMDVDFIAFQECAQNQSTPDIGNGIHEDNMALIIRDLISDNYGVDYNYSWDWAHYGWSVWEEGVAVLSKHPLIDSDSRYVSTSTSTGNLTSRKVIYGSYQVPEGNVNLFSAHTHWRLSETDEEQNNQIQNIKDMVVEKEGLGSNSLSLVCGDFNSNPTSDYPWSEGYNTMMVGNEYVDSFLDVNPDANTTPAQSIYNTIGGSFPGRIDYVFMGSHPNYSVLASQIIFTNSIVGSVSDHFGVLTKIEYNQ